MVPASQFLTIVLVPALKWLAQTVGPRPPNVRESRVLLTAISGEESHWQNVVQFGGGPGRGYFQIEPETCGLVLNNPVSSAMMHTVCSALAIPPTELAIYTALIGEPLLQVALSRLDLWCDPRPLPAYGDSRAAWLYYKRVWGPGRPHPAIWDGIYDEAMQADKAYVAAGGGP